MITALLFDFGGTLDGPAHWLDRFLAQYRAAGIEIARAELDPAFEHATRIGYDATRIVSRFGLTDLVRFLVGHQCEFLRKEGPPAIRELLEEGGAHGRHRIVESMTASFVRETVAGLAHSRDVLTKLKPRYRLGVVSNFYGNLDRVLAEARIERLLAATADSSRVGAFKPAREIFEFALNKMHVESSKAAMVGDSLNKDCAPARALGMRAIWYRPHPSESSGASGADLTIASLDELAELSW